MGCATLCAWGHGDLFPPVNPLRLVYDTAAVRRRGLRAGKSCLRSGSARRIGPLVMRAIQTSRHGFLLRTALAVPLGLLLLCASVLAVSPILHHVAHSDADSASHICMATIMAKGDFLTVASQVLLPRDLPPEPAWQTPQAVILPAAVDVHVHGSRAPPLLIPSVASS